MLKAIEQDDFDLIGQIMESTNLMHETMLKSNPSFSYITNETKKCIEFVKSQRKNGLNIYYNGCRIKC